MELNTWLYLQSHLPATTINQIIGMRKAWNADNIKNIVKNTFKH